MVSQQRRKSPVFRSMKREAGRALGLRSFELAVLSRSLNVTDQQHSFLWITSGGRYCPLSLCLGGLKSPGVPTH